MRYIAFFLLALSFAFSAGAQTDEAVLTDEALAEAGVTPDSALHVFDRFGDWVRLNVFTFNKVRKAEIKAEIAEERLSELKEVIDSESEEDVIASAEALASSSAEGVQSDVEELSDEGRDIAGLLEKFNELSLKQQSVLERVFDKAPEQAKKHLLHAMEVSARGFVKVEEVLEKQLASGRLDGARAEAILAKRVANFRAQVERRSDYLAKLEEEFGEVPSEIRDRFEEKVRLLEDHLINVESKEEFKAVRDVIRAEIKDAIVTARAIRARYGIEDDEIEAILEDIEEGKLDVQERADEIIKEAEEGLEKLKSHIEEVQQKSIELKENVKSLYDNALQHIENAKRAFEAGDYGHAFGQAVAALHNVKNALRALEPLLEGEDNIKEKIQDAKEAFRKFEEEVKAFAEKFGRVPEAVEKILLVAGDQIKKAEQALSEGRLREALSHIESAKKMISHGRDLLKRLENKTSESSDEGEDLEKRAKKELEDIREEKEARLEVLMPLIKPIIRREERKDEMICAQVLTPAKNVKTGECKMFRNSCLPDGWKLDRECQQGSNTDNSDNTSGVKPEPDSTVSVTPSVKPSPSAARIHRVKITSDGFSPRELAVQKGDTVQWTNDSDRPSWPASALHPTHTVLPGFDALAGLKNGESYKFQFNEAGSWKYHNHLNPAMTGAVIVK